MEKKILIISHNPIGEQDNMGKTLKNIFNGFSSREICQIYLRDQTPDFSICNQYFYIDESSVVKSVFNSKIDTGKIIHEKAEKKITETATEDNSLKDRIYNFGRKRTQLIYLLRDYVWSKGKWFSKGLVEWLELQQPTCIFFMAGDYRFSMRIAMDLADYCGIPLFSYYVDEFYFYKPKVQKIPIEAKKYQKVFKLLFDKSKMNFCISEMMKIDYQKEFGKNTEILMNVGDYVNNNSNLFDKKKIQMYYMGNISAGRWKNLSILSSVVEKVNGEKKYQINFEIYSGEKDESILRPFLQNKDVKFCGEISANEVQEKMLNADILIHTESFEKEDMDVVKYSVSTKIPELLASGKILLALGPDGVESINYLKRNHAGLIIDSLEDIEKKLTELIEEENYHEILNSQRKLLRKNHNRKENQERLNQYLV